MLRMLSKSILYVPAESEKNNPYQFEYTGTKNTVLTGRWEDDSQYFKLRRKNEVPTESSRLILGLGPSAAGKTFSARVMIQYLSVVSNPWSIG